MTTRARGADFSSFQDVGAVTRFVHAHDPVFSFVKTTQGLEYVNPIARQQIALLEQGGRRVGVYQFLSHDADGARQWDHFETTLRWVGRPLVACDQESDRGVLVSDAIARAFIKRGQQRGFKVGRYGDARVMSRSLGEDWRWWARWAATPPAGRWDFWQFAAGESYGPGEPDRNVFRGDPAQLELFWSKHSKTSRPSAPRWWLHDEHEKRALGPYRLAQLGPRLLAYIARHPRSLRYELVRK